MAAAAAAVAEHGYEELEDQEIGFISELRKPKDRRGASSIQARLFHLHYVLVKPAEWVSKSQASLCGKAGTKRSSLTKRSHASSSPPYFRLVDILIHHHSQRPSAMPAF